jgi:hypothetical protein
MRADVRLGLQRITALHVGLDLQGLRLLCRQGVEDLFEQVRSCLDLVHQHSVLEIEQSRLAERNIIHRRQADGHACQEVETHLPHQKIVGSAVVAMEDQNAHNAVDQRVRPVVPLHIQRGKQPLVDPLEEQFVKSVLG